MTRRALLRSMVVMASAALTAPLAVACGGQAPAPEAPKPAAAPPAPAPAPAPPPVPTQGPLPTAKPGGQSAPAAPTAPAAAAGKRGGSIVTASAGDAVTFHPYLRTDSASGSYQSMIYDTGLWDYDPRTLEQKPAGASGWKVSDDRLTYTFTLRDDLKWSDGKPLTSADYKFAFDNAVKPENKYPYISNLQLIASYEAPDPRTIVVKMKEPVVVALEAADAVTPLPKHVWEKLDWSDPAKNPEILSPTLSCGPYKLKEWKRDNYVSFVANDLYYKGRPLIDEVTIRIVPTVEIQYQMLKTGEVDYASFSPDNYPEAKKLPNVTVYEWWPAAAAWSYLGYNLRRPGVDDVIVRRALAHAVDRDGIATGVMNGLARPTFSVFPPSSWVFNPNVPKYELDAGKAKALLDQAGWKAGPGGARERDGKRLELRLIFGPNTSKTRERIATVVQQAWGDLGVKVEIQGMEWGAYLNALKSEPFDWDICVLGWNSTLEPHWMNQIWREDSIPALNAGAYINKKVEQLFDQGVKEFDREKRKSVYQEIQQLISNDAPYVFLTTDLSYVGVNNRIGGIEPTPLGIGHNREAWFIK